MFWQTLMLKRGERAGTFPCRSQDQRHPEPCTPTQDTEACPSLTALESVPPVPQHASTVGANVYSWCRSCRARLNLHNDRRRKRVPEHNTPRQDLQNPQPRGRRTRTRRKRLLYGEQAGSDELEALDAEVEAVSLNSFPFRASQPCVEGRSLERSVTVWMLTVCFPHCQAESDGTPETRRGSWRPQVGGQPQELLGEGPLTQSPTHPRGGVQQAWGLTPAYRVSLFFAFATLLPPTCCLRSSSFGGV